LRAARRADVVMLELVIKDMPARERSAASMIAHYHGQIKILPAC
jgi:hypothetical protein